MADKTDTPDKPVLTVSGLSVGFKTDLGKVDVVDDVSFELYKGETLGIVGESGSGKSVTAKTIMRLLPSPPSYISAGTVILEPDGEGKPLDLAKARERALRTVRGNRLSMIFQEPMTALNPVFTVGFQIDEVLRLHCPELSRKGRREKAIEMLDKVGIPAPEKRVDEFPHQLSGGMRQRAMIAMALSTSPDVLFADEPTTALDVTIQAQILNLINDLKRDFGMATVLITHDLGVVAEVCDRVLVMYAGRVVEQGSVFDIFDRPGHPYTRALLESLPKAGRHAADHQSRKLPTIEGLVPSPKDFGVSCRFFDRCTKSQLLCSQEKPPKIELGDGRWALCQFPEGKE